MKVIYDGFNKRQVHFPGSRMENELVFFVRSECYIKKEDDRISATTPLSSPCRLASRRVFFIRFPNSNNTPKGYVHYNKAFISLADY